MSWDYGKAFETNPIGEGEAAVWPDGSMVCVNNIFDEVPSFMKQADCVFVDPPWNIGNLNSFYTKAGRDDYPINYDTFSRRVFAYIKAIRPDICYVEIGKEYLADYIMEMRKIIPYVTFYNSSYYHKRENKCYVVRGSRKAKKPDLDYLDEEDIIQWVCKNESYSCICDFCMGRGLVGRYAAEAGRKFVGGELNPKRLSVLLKALGGYEIKKGERYGLL